MEQGKEIEIIVSYQNDVWLAMSLKIQKLNRLLLINLEIKLSILLPI